MLELKSKVIVMNLQESSAKSAEETVEKVYAAMSQHTVIYN
jgi:hypothetical protein